MSRALDQTEQLRAGEDEVEDLRGEEQQHSLGEVTLDCDRRKCHPCKVTESVAWESPRRVPTLSLYRSSTHQLCHRNPAQAPTRGIIKYRLIKWRLTTSPAAHARSRPSSALPTPRPFNSHAGQMGRKSRSLSVTDNAMMRG